MMTAAQETLGGALSYVPVIAVLRAREAAQYSPVMQVLVDAGIKSIELTMTTPGTLDALPALRSALPADVDLGVGTILTIADARTAAANGADYLVTPHTDDELIIWAQQHEIPLFPGGLTPTELQRAWSLGVTAVKLFPASTVGTDFIRNLHGPFPTMRIIPSGGINCSDAIDWLDAGAAAVSVGGPLLGDVFASGDYNALAERARNLVRAIRGRNE